MKYKLQIGINTKLHTHRAYTYASIPIRPRRKKNNNRGALNEKASVSAQCNGPKKAKMGKFSIYTDNFSGSTSKVN